MTNYYLGISAFYHDSAAALISSDKIIAAAHEERFTRRKHDQSFPVHALRYVLAESGLALEDMRAIAFYDKPLLKFERLLETYHAYAPRGLASFIAAIPVWAKEKMFLRNLIWQELKTINGGPLARPPVLLFPEHHLSHAASAFYPSPFSEAAILTVDGVGEWTTTAIAHGRQGEIEILRELYFPHSIGLLYSAFTYYCGFKVNSGEYKLMGLAPYGLPGSERVKAYRQAITDELVDIREDGSLLLNMDYFAFATGLKMCHEKKWEALFGLSPRRPETPLTQPYMDMALAIQEVTEEVVLKLAGTARDLTGSRNLVLAGGVALNCVANGKIQRARLFDSLWIQPAAGDAGGSLGAALAARHIWNREPRNVADRKDFMQGSFLGPEYGPRDLLRVINRHGAVALQFEDFDELSRRVAKLIATGKVIGWFQGRMEWGPRALGNRSILADPRNPEIQKHLNLKIKYRESFRPFAPSVLAEEAHHYFELESDSPYMLLVAPVNQERRKRREHKGADDIRERLYEVRSDIPAVTHIDYSARIQTVHRETNERYWRLISAFAELTGYALLVNTSFNVRGEPIVCSPEDAYRCFMRTDMDFLVVNDHIFDKASQPSWSEEREWQQEFHLD